MTTRGSWGLPREAPLGPLSWSRLLGAAVGLPTRALPQPARWMAPDQTGPQPQYHGHPIRPGVVPPGHQSMVGEGVGCAASAGGSGLTPRTGPTPPSPCEASGCRAAQTRCSGPWWDPSASSGVGSALHEGRGDQPGGSSQLLPGAGCGCQQPGQWLVVRAYPRGMEEENKATVPWGGGLRGRSRESAVSVMLAA